MHCAGLHHEEGGAFMNMPCLVTVDLQVDFLPGNPFGREENEKVSKKAGRLCEAFRKKGFPIVHVVRIYLPDGSNAEPFRRSSIVSKGGPVLAYSRGSQLAPDLLESPIELDVPLLLAGKPQWLGPSECIIYKSRFGAFYKTCLEEVLMRLGASTLVFSGSNFPNCPRSSIYEACERDYNIIAAEDAISGLYERGKKELENIGVMLMKVDEIISAFSTL
jgi:nicotinamidase-related amidase